MRGALLRDARRLRRFELERLAAAGHAIFLSSDDAARAAGSVPGLETVVVPPVFGDGALPRSPRDADGRLELLFVANLDWWPNRLALAWLRRDVLPGAGDRVRLHLVGVGTEGVEAANGRVVRHGHVRSLDRVLAAVDVAIAPTVAGGGVSVKVAEMAYRGLPLLVRRRALRGLPIDADDATVALDRASEWVSFLRSEDALRLARARPDDARAAPFTIDRYVPAVAGLLHGAARSGGLRAPRRT
jgi:glycosyl transferase family 1